MALIRATCSDCGDVELLSRDMRVRTCTDTDESTYLFRCPVCRMVEVRLADPHVVDILLAAGCRGEAWCLPAELHDLSRAHPQPVTHDDVLDFHILLTELSDEQIIVAAQPFTTEDQDHFLGELEQADSGVITHELEA